MVGQGGLQEALNTKLAGTPGLAVQALDATGKPVSTLATVAAPQAGTPVTLTLDRAVQTAAEATLSTVALPAAIVVTQPSTGKVLAVANDAAAGGDIALAGQYPPGSTFKIVTYTGVFSNDPSRRRAPRWTARHHDGQRPDRPQRERVRQGHRPDQRRLRVLLQHQCRRAGPEAATGALYKAAASLGLGQKWDLPVDAFSGSMPTDAQSNELAAEGYGQGKTLVSPLLMAEIAGGAATGTAIAPSLVEGSPGARLGRAAGRGHGLPQHPDA